ncbi:DNA-processing protein DprA [Tropicimonas sp. IMCC34011]|uniref:DNA-processing protein DprA n=1 Tax=Tropicimonas sp. IMCC34011 TaxID=2248759 RepID=UPI000E21EBE4
MDLFSSPPPLAPPTPEGDRLARLRLLRSRRVGPKTYRRLLHQSGGDPHAALDALPGIARKAGMGEYRPCSRGEAEAELEAGRAAGARLIHEGDPDWPPGLADLAEAPPMLWARGPGLPCLFRRSVAVVGARNASSLGLRMARKLCGELAAEGLTIVSGLARGIDAEAHRCALQTGTVAVVAGGVDVVYPKENAELTDQIASSGLILSEMPCGMRPQARHFPRRNRLVAALAEAVLVIEAAARSGSLITARNAGELGRDVLAVPGHPLDGRAEGCNLLIREGATLIRRVEDVMEALTPLSCRKGETARDKGKAEAGPTRTAPPVARQTPDSGEAVVRTRILALLGPSPVAEDQVIRDLGLPARQVGAALVALELGGEVERLPGGLLARRKG